MIYTEHGMAFMSFSVEGWGDFKIAKILPRNGTAWGIFSELPEDHPWRSLIPEVKEELIDLAISGHPKPFLDQGIRDANACLILAGLEDECPDRDYCPAYKKSKCSIRSRETPECFNYEGLDEHESYLVKAWLEGYSVVLCSN